MRLIIILFFISSIAFGQKTIYTVTKKDGTVYKAKSYSTKLVKNLKFKKINGEVVTFPYPQIDKIEYVATKKWEKLDKKNKKENVLLRFINISNRNGSLMRVLVDGECSLYMDVSHGMGSSVITYFVKKKDEKIATRLLSRQAIRSSLKSNASKYFKDCPQIIVKIKERIFTKKNLPKLVEFYNANCN